MKRGKDEDKVMGPMFPRLHVNEIDKRGPRAPPRNKMALYEQLSIPSHRFSHVSPAQNSNSSAANIVTSSSQGGGSEKSKLFSRLLPLKHQLEKHCSQSSDSVAPLAHVDEGKELDDEDFRVPIFIRSRQSMEHSKHTDVSSTGKMPFSRPSFFNPSLKIQKSIICIEENSKEQIGGLVKAIPSSRLIEKDEIEQKQSDLSPFHKTGGNPVNTSERLKSDRSVQPELCSELPSFVSNTHCNSVFQESASTIDKRNGSPVTIVLSSTTSSHEDGSCDSPQVVNLERDDSVTEISIVATLNELDITPDDIVRLIGPKCFFKARRAIANQQRVFSDQLFELHRLITVQRSIATSHFLLDITNMAKPMKALPGKTLSMDFPIKSFPNTSRHKSESEKPRAIENSAENTVGKSTLTSFPNAMMPANCRSVSSNPSSISISSNHNARPVCFNQPQGTQWLIPVMSHSEGLVYKPYPGPGYVGSSCGSWGMPGSNVALTNNFLTPAYGVPAPYPPQYQFPSFPVTGPRPFFPAYGMPVMDTTHSSSTIEQVIQPSIRSQLSIGNTSSQGNVVIPSSANLHASEDIELQASTASSLSERMLISESGNVIDRRNNPQTLSKHPAENKLPTRVIKVVPHKAGSVNESVARIFRSIQEDRQKIMSL